MRGPSAEETKKMKKNSDCREKDSLGKGAD